MSATLADMATGVHQFLEGDTGYTPSATVNEYSNVLSGKVSGPNNDLKIQILRIKYELQTKWR